MPGHRSLCAKNVTPCMDALSKCHYYSCANTATLIVSEYWRFISSFEAKFTSDGFVVRFKNVNRTSMRVGVGVFGKQRKGDYGVKELHC